LQKFRAFLILRPLFHPCFLDKLVNPFSKVEKLHSFCYYCLSYTAKIENYTRKVSFFL
jgi:hypothetical protein